MRWTFNSRPMLAPPEAAAGASGTGSNATGASGAGTTPGTGVNGAAASAAGGATLWDFNDLPEGLRAGSNEETFGKVKGQYFELRNKVSAFAPPKSAAEYKFEPADKIKPYFKDVAKDPLLGLARETAHKLGMPDTHFGAFINNLFTAASEKGMLPPVFDPGKEIDAIGKLVAPSLAGAPMQAEVQKAITEATAFAPAYADHHKLSPAVKALLTSVADEAGGVELLRHLKASNREIGPQLGGEARAQGYSQADYDKDVADPRYSPFSPKYDKDWRAGIDAKMRTLFGG